MAPKPDLGRVSHRAAALQFSSDMLSARFAELAERPLADKCDLLLRDLGDAVELVTAIRDWLRGKPDAD